MMAGRVNVSNGYVEIGVDGRRYQAHRLAFLMMTGAWPEDCLDHINGARADNRWSNIRQASACENARNSCRPVNNRSGFKGVSWKARNRKWVAQIAVQNRKIHIGLFDTAEAAHAAYVTAARRYHGEFARAA
jgi:hypothetical protein